MLTSDSESEVVSETLMQFDFFHSFQVFSHFGVPVVCYLVGVGAVLGVLSSIKHPSGDVIV